MCHYIYSVKLDNHLRRPNQTGSLPKLSAFHLTNNSEPLVDDIENKHSQLEESVSSGLLFIVKRVELTKSVSELRPPFP